MVLDKYLLSAGINNISKYEKILTFSFALKWCAFAPFGGFVVTTVPVSFPSECEHFEICAVE